MKKMVIMFVEEEVLTDLSLAIAQGCVTAGCDTAVAAQIGKDFGELADKQGCTDHIYVENASDDGGDKLARMTSALSLSRKD